MLDVIANLLSSVAAFLFPIFASYKAVQTSDPAQLTPWLIYWVVLAGCLLVESWTAWVLVWIPFYAYFRLFFLLYLVLPQTQGARVLYQTHLHPWLRENESQIDDFIASAHSRLRTAGIAYLRQFLELLRTRVLGHPPAEPTPPAYATTDRASSQSLTQALLARFSMPAARWTASNTASAGADFYSLLAGAVSALGASAPGTAHDPTASTAYASASGTDPLVRSATLIPPSLSNTDEKMTFIAAQRARLNVVLGALDREACELQREETIRGTNAAQYARVSSMSFDGGDGTSGASGSGNEEPLPRPPSGLSVFSGFSSLSKTRSEPDFEKIEVDSGAEDEAGLRRRYVAAAPTTPPAAATSLGTGQRTPGASWIPWGWAVTPTTSDESGD